MMMRKGQFWLLLGFAPAIALTTALDSSRGQTGALNAAFVGFLLIVASGIELAGLHRWMDVAKIALGAWLAVSPFALAYADDAYIAFAHVILGSLLALLGANRVLQEWRANLREGR